MPKQLTNKSAIFIALALVAAGAYFYFVPKQITNGLDGQQSLSIVSCEELRGFNINAPSPEARAAGFEKYTYWKDIVSNLYPVIDVYDVGSLCILNNNQTLITMSYSVSTPKRDSGQKIILLDEQYQVIKEANAFSCKPVGDLDVLTYVESVGNEAVFSCVASHPEKMRTVETYTLNLDTFAVVP